MFAQPWKETIEFLASVATIIGFVIGLGYIRSINNNIVNVKVDRVTINNFNYALPEKNFIGKVYENKKVGEFNL